LGQKYKPGKAEEKSMNWDQDKKPREFRPASTQGGAGSVSDPGANFRSAQPPAGKGPGAGQNISQRPFLPRDRKRPTAPGEIQRESDQAWTPSIEKKRPPQPPDKSRPSSGADTGKLPSGEDTGRLPTHPDPIRISTTPSLHPSQLGDQRRYSRMKMIMGMVCHRKGASDINVFTDDVSSGGIKFTCHVDLQRDEEVFLDVPIGNNEYKSIPGRIAWLRKGHMNYEGGIEFYRLDDATKKLWEKFIEKNVEKKTP
jgi:hypothetical protein